MSEIKKKSIILGLIGGAVGALICFFMSSFTGSGEAVESISAKTPVFYYVISFLHGAICMGSSVVYSIESWSVVRCTLTHFLITLTSFYILGTLQEWLEFFSPTFWIITACFVVAYFMIWLIMYLRYRKEVRQMNEDLNRFITSSKEDETKKNTDV